MRGSVDIPDARHGVHVMGARRRFTDAQLDEAEALRATGEKWAVINLILGEGIDQSVRYRNMGRYVTQFSEAAERRKFERRNDVPASRLYWCPWLNKYLDAEINAEWQGWRRCALSRVSV